MSSSFIQKQNVCVFVLGLKATSKVPPRMQSSIDPCKEVLNFFRAFGCTHA